jgi:hypothetical protein
VRGGGGVTSVDGWAELGVGREEQRDRRERVDVVDATPVRLKGHGVDDVLDIGLIEAEDQVPGRNPIVTSELERRIMVDVADL